MAMFFRKLAKAAPIAFTNAFRDQTKSSFSSFRTPFGAIAAISGGISYYYYFCSPDMAHLDQINEEEGRKIALNPDKWVEFELQDTARVSHNTKLFRFSFDPTAKLGLDIASCLLTRAPLGQDAEGKTKYVVRPYTPISDPDSKGYFDLLIKVYPEGKMSQHLASLKPGDVLEVKGPIEKLRYTPNMKKHIGMIAGGTGITPMLQIIEAILKNPEDNTQVSLLYANISPDDILLKEKLDILSDSHPNLKIYYTVDNPSKTWRGGAGYISKDMVVKGLPSPSADTLILVCGPPGMMKHISGDKAKDRSQGELTGLLKELGYTEDMDLCLKVFGGSLPRQGQPHMTRSIPNMPILPGFTIPMGAPATNKGRCEVEKQKPRGAKDLLLWGFPHRRAFTTTGGMISLAISWEDVTTNGVADLHGTL